MKKKLSVHDKAIRLCEGGVVEVDANWVKAIVIDDDDSPCLVCPMDCACTDNMCELCNEMDAISGFKRVLKFVSEP